MERDDVEPVVEIFAKIAREDRALKIEIRSRDDSDVDLDDLLGIPDTVELSILQYAKQLGLEIARDFPDFVEKNRAAICRFEKPRSVGYSAGEGALGVPEQLALEQGVRQRSAVDADQGAIGTAGVAMDRASHDILAGPRLSSQQDADIRPGHPLGSFEQCQHRLVFGDDCEFIRCRRLVGFCLACALRLLDVCAAGPGSRVRLFRGIGLGRFLQDVLDQWLEFVLNREGLCEVVHSSSLHGFTGRVYRGKSCDDDDFDPRSDQLAAAQHFEAICFGHAQVGDDDVDGVLLEQRETMLWVTRREDLVSFRTEASMEEAGDTGFVVDDEEVTQF